jgi:hypothetical protein
MNSLHHSLGDHELDTVSGGFLAVAVVAVAVAVGVILIAGSGTSNDQNHKGARPDGNGTRG